MHQVVIVKELLPVVQFLYTLYVVLTRLCETAILNCKDYIGQ